MSSITTTPSYGTLAGRGTALGTFGAEVTALVRALLSPGKIIGEVEAMHALQVEANRIEATDPVQAAALRSRASRIGLHP